MNLKKLILKIVCYYFDDVMSDRNICFDDMLFDKKSYKTSKNILIYNIS